MKVDNILEGTGVAATLQSVLDRLATHTGLSPIRKRDLRSAVTCLAKLVGKSPAAILLDLGELRQALDSIPPARFGMSSKRYANLRSDLVAAIAASGLRPMLKSARLGLDEHWSRLLGPAEDRIQRGLSRLAHWASRRLIRPESIDNNAIDRFCSELENASLIRNLHRQRRRVALAWNLLVARVGSPGLRPVSVPPSRKEPTRTPWRLLPISFPDDVERYLDWASVPDPLAEGARRRPLSRLTLRLQRNYIHSAATAAIAAGIPATQLVSLARLVEAETFRALLRQRWQEDGCKLTFYTHGIAVTLIAIAAEWVKASPDAIASLKALRAKLGTPALGLTEKNRALLRAFEDPRRRAALVELPDKLWHTARRAKPPTSRSFLDLQIALAIDLLFHVPLRMQNLTALKFEEHLHWPRGRRKPALLTFRGDETKNREALEFELPTTLSDRLWIYRHEIAPAVIGERPDRVFVSTKGTPRTQVGIATSITKALLRHLGVRMTPHQFRHLDAKIILDEMPGAYELARQVLGHKNLQTTTNFYAGIDTRRAGRAHAELIRKIRESKLGRSPRRVTRRPGDDSGNDET